MLDMSTEFNRFAEAFNRFESFIWSEGKGKLPFRVTNPINYASMTKADYARLSSLALASTKNKTVSLSFEQLELSKQQSFHLWQALYDEDLERALALYQTYGETAPANMGQAVKVAQLLMADNQDERAWQLLMPVILRRACDHYYEIVWLELLWDEKTRPLMTPERCHQLLTSERGGNDQGDAPGVRLIRERDRLNYICSLARCLTESAVDDLEAQVAAESDNLELRLMLIGAYSKYDAKNLAKKKPHISWLIARYPDSQIIEDLLFYLFLDKEAIAVDFEEFKQQWLESIEKDPGNTNILFNASLLLGVDDKALAEELLTRAQTMDPTNAKFAERLYELNAFQVKDTTGSQRRLHAREALRQLDIIENLDEAASPEPFSRLKIMRRRAWYSLETDELETCQKLLLEMVALAQTEGFDSTYQFLSRVIKGRLALKLGETEKAIQYMMSTLDLEPFTHFRHDYPHLTLIAELVLAGQNEAVLAFFELDRKQWPEGYSQWLEHLLAEIEQGKPLAVPAVML